MQECEDELKSTLAQYEAGLAEHEKTNAGYGQAREQLEVSASQLKAQEKLHKKILDGLNAAIKEQVNADSAVDQYTKKLRAEQDKLLSYQTQDADVLAEIAVSRLHFWLRVCSSRTNACTARNFQMKTEQAQAVCDRPEGKKKSAKKLELEIETLERALAARARNHGATLPELAENLAQRRQTVEKAVKDTRDLGNLSAVLQEAYQRRIVRWTEFRDQIASRAKVQFMYHLSNRGYTGRLQFDHDKARLNLRVQTEEATNASQRKAAKGKDTKNVCHCSSDLMRSH